MTKPKLRDDQSTTRPKNNDKRPKSRKEEGEDKSKNTKPVFIGPRKRIVEGRSKEGSRTRSQN